MTCRQVRDADACEAWTPVFQPTNDPRHYDTSESVTAFISPRGFTTLIERSGLPALQYHSIVIVCGQEKVPSWVELHDQGLGGIEHVPQDRRLCWERLP